MKARFLAVFCLVAASRADALDLDGYLRQVVQSHRGLEALRLQRDAADEKRLSGDLSLVPVLTVQGSYLSDKKLPNQLGADAFEMRQYSASLSKRFSTGTAVSLSARATGSENTNITNPAMASFGQYAQGSLGISLSQSLWKDAFGRATRLRREREGLIEQADVGAADLQSRQILAAAESAFWETLSAQEELRLRRASLERAQKIETWIRRRVSDGISDRADLLNAQALVAQRRLQLSNIEDDSTAARTTLRDQLELASNQPLPPLSGDLRKPRELRRMVDGEGRIVRLDVWLSQLEAQARGVGALEAEEATKADLNLSGSYATNSYEPNGAVPTATKEWTKTDRPTGQVALTWTYLFDTDTKEAAAQSARAQAAAAKVAAERKVREGETAWTEMVRRHAELTKKIAAMEELESIQSARAKAQADKLARGRAITIDVINSEQDAAEAESQLARMRTERRKLEAQARLFVTVRE